MKKLVLLFACFFLLTQSCKKETFTPDPIGIVQFYSAEEAADWMNEHSTNPNNYTFQARDFEEAFANRGGKPLCFNVLDLIGISSTFGLSVADYIPTIPNDYFQDANCNVAKWTAHLYERDPLDSTANNVGTPSVVNITWQLDGDTAISTGGSYELPLYTYTLDDLGNTVVNKSCPGIFQPSCDGTHICVITMTFADGSVYQRTGTVYGQVNNIPEDILDCDVEYNDSDLNVFDFSCFCPLTFEPYEFLIESGLEYDVDNSGTVDVLDFIFVSSNFGGC